MKLVFRKYYHNSFLSLRAMLVFKGMVMMMIIQEWNYTAKQFILV